MLIRFTDREITKFYLSKASMTPKKLQKILYFAYSWYLTLMNDDKDNIDIKLFDGNFEAWIHGPISPSIYEEYKKYRADMIPKKQFELEDLTDDDLDILNSVWEVYGKYTANQLQSISCQHAPWKLTREESNCNHSDWCEDKIKDIQIFNYYTNQLKIV